MTPAYSDPLVTLYEGDCLDIMRELPDASVDAVVTDPPYGLEFMAKDWDAPWKKGEGTGEHNAGFKLKRYKDGSTAPIPNYTGSTNPTCRTCGGTKFGNDRNSRERCKCDQPTFPNTTLPRMMAYQLWCTEWATEAFRVLKPGGYILAFGGTRTYHRLASAIEDAGFEIRDTLMWIYASGFPKSLDVSKAVDKVAPRDAMFVPFARHYGEQRRASGMTHAQVCAAIGAHGEVNHGGASTNWEAGHNVPTLAYWQKLQPLLDLSDEWLPLIERIEAEREKVGEKDGITRPGFAGEVYGPNGGDKVVVDITAPATDLARKWEGWGTALKPAHEPIVMARKPLIGTVAANVTRYGTGALNIDGTRIPGEPWQAHDASGLASVKFFTDGEAPVIHKEPHNAGRWPSNVLLSSPELFDEPNPGVVGSGATTTTGSIEAGSYSPQHYGGDRMGPQPSDWRGDSGGYSRFFIIPKADRAERERGLAGHATKEPRGAPIFQTYCVKCGRQKVNVPGSACQCAEPEWSQRGVPQNARANTHPTVKPIDLMRHLVRLVTPPNGVVLDPFAGSGTTALAASEEGFKCIGIEREAEYVEIAVGRLIATPMGLGLEAEVVAKPMKSSNRQLGWKGHRSSAGSMDMFTRAKGDDEEDVA